MTDTTTSAATLGLLRQLGAELGVQAVVLDNLPALSVGEAVAAVRPDVAAEYDRLMALGVTFTQPPTAR